MFQGEELGKHISGYAGGLLPKSQVAVCARQSRRAHAPLAADSSGAPCREAQGVRQAGGFELKVLARDSWYHRPPDVMPKKDTASYVTRLWQKYDLTLNSQEET